MLGNKAKAAYELGVRIGGDFERGRRDCGGIEPRGHLLCELSMSRELMNSDTAFQPCGVKGLEDEAAAHSFLKAHEHAASETGGYGLNTQISVGRNVARAAGLGNDRADCGNGPRRTRELNLVHAPILIFDSVRCWAADLRRPQDQVVCGTCSALVLCDVSSALIEVVEERKAGAQTYRCRWVNANRERPKDFVGGERTCPDSEVVDLPDASRSRVRRGHYT